ncbi:MAG: ATP-binding cassette domain-containing protein [Eubacteriaceae bacterium]|nr:ATP-binding cassette domain-containing protein [Eubacteriaceae bacterium]
MIQVSNLRFAYPGSSPLFSSLSVSIGGTWSLGLVGANGAGKTTLLKLLYGKLEPTSGSIYSTMGFSYFPYEIADVSLAAMDIARGIASWAEDWEIASELSDIGFDLGKLEYAYGLLSGGEQTKLMLAALFLDKSKFALIDEPTNHLDKQARAKLASYLSRRQGFVLASHDRALLDGCCKHILSINKTSVELSKGNYSVYIGEKAKKDLAEKAANERLEKDIKRLEKSKERTARWSDKTEKSKYKQDSLGPSIDRGYVGARAAKMMKRSKAIGARIEQSIEEKKGLLQDVENPQQLRLFPERHHSSLVVSMKGVSLFYGDACAAGNVDLEINRGERISIEGVNGSGKSSVAKLIAGVFEGRWSGDFYVAKNIKAAYLPQNTKGLKGSLLSITVGIDTHESVYYAQLAKMGFKPEDFRKDISEFSEGMKKKALLAASICSKAHIYIWDEPLNYIDALSREAIEQMVLEAEPTMVFIEHDERFCEKIATSRIVLG